MSEPEDSKYLGFHFRTQQEIAKTSCRYGYSIPLPYVHIGDISNPQTKEKLVEKILRCIQIMQEAIDEQTELETASTLEMHVRVGPLLRELKKDGIILPRGVKAKDALEALRQVVEILEKKRPKQTPVEALMYPQVLQQIDELKQALGKPDSILCTKLKDLKNKLRDKAPYNITNNLRNPS